MFEWTGLLELEMFLTSCLLMLNWIVWNRTDYLYKKNLALNNLQMLICHKNPTNQPTNQVEINKLNYFI